MTPRARRSFRRTTLAIAAALPPLVASVPAYAQPTKAEGTRVTLDVRAESDVLVRRSANVAFLERLAAGFALGGKTAFIGGASLGAIVGSNTTSFVLISPYVGARFRFEPRYALDLTVSYQQFIALDDQLEPIPGGFLSRESFGYGGTIGAAFSVRLSDSFSLCASLDVGAAAFDHDELYVSPPRIAAGFKSGLLAFGGLALVMHLPL